MGRADSWSDMETALGRPVIFTVLVTLFVTTLSIGCVTGAPRCPQKLTGDGVLQFEDTSLFEYTGETLYKELSCYAKNFCTITWKKDGRPINTLLEQSLLNRGQVLPLKSVGEKDEGVYTCTASANGKSIQQNIVFRIIKDCNKNQAAINIQHPGCVNTTADIGSNVTFHCEFFIGTNQLQDPENWFKFKNSAGSNASLDDNDNWLYLPFLSEEINKQGTVYTTSSYFAKMKNHDMDSDKCGNKPIFGVKLEIWNVSEFAYGTYALNVVNDGVDSWKVLQLSQAVPAMEPRVSFKDVNHNFTYPMGCVMLFVLVTSVVWRRFRTDIKLLFKDHPTCLSSNSQDVLKDYDVYLSYDWYSDTDRMFASKLASFMEEKGYKVFWEINCLPGGDTDEDIVKALETSWRSVIIFSPDYLASRRNFDVIFSMDQAKHYKKEIIPIIYRNISDVPEEHKSALVRHVLASPCLRFDQVTTHPANRVKKIVQKVWGDPQSEQSLHKELLLRLPSLHRTSQVPLTPSAENLTATEVRPYVSTRNSTTQYNEGQRQLVAFEPGQNTQRLYPNISDYGHLNVEVNI